MKKIEMHLNDFAKHILFIYTPLRYWEEFISWYEVMLNGFFFK